MTDKQIIFKCDVDCIRKNTEECFELDCIKGQESILKQLKAKEQECERLKKWLPIVTRLEEQFKSHEKAKSIGYKTYAEQVFTELDQLKAENEKLKVWKSITPLKTKMLVKALSEIKQLLEDALDTDKTSAEQSFDNLYEALEKCEVLDE